MVIGLAFLATAVATLFAQATLVRFTKDRRPQDLAWTVSLALFALASAALATGVSTGWDNGLFRIFFLLGAVLTVPWLALGTVYLLAGKERGRRVQWGLVFFSGLAAGVLFTAPIDGPITGTAIPVGSEVFGVFPACSRPPAAAWVPSSSSAGRCGRRGASLGRARLPGTAGAPRPTC